MTLPSLTIRKCLEHLSVADPMAAERMAVYLQGFDRSTIISHMAQVVDEVIEALAVEITFGRTLAAGAGRMLANGTPAELARYRDLVKIAAGQGPTQAGIVARHLAPVLTCGNADIADNFEKTIQVMLKKGTYTLKAPLETLSALIEKKEIACAHAFLELLVATYSLDLTYNRSVYLTHTLPCAILGFSPNRRLWQIKGLTRIVPIDERLADAYLQGLASGLDLLSEKALNRFMDLAIQRHEKTPESGIRFLSLDSQQAIDICREFQVAVPLSEVRSGLERYLCARTGLAVAIRSLSPLSDTAHQPPSVAPLVRCDGRTIYLPEEMSIMEKRSENAAVYKLLVKLEAGSIEFGTYELDVEKAMDGSHTDLPVSFSENPASDSELARFAKGFHHPDLALDLFTIFEHARISKKVRRRYPGLFRRQVETFSDRDLMGKTRHRIGGALYPLYEKMVIGGNPPADPNIFSMARAMEERFKEMVAVTGEDTAETSARLTMEWYPKVSDHFGKIPRFSYAPLCLPFGKRLDPDYFGSFYDAYYQLAVKIRNELKKRDIYAYRSDIQNLLIRQNGQVSAADIRHRFIASSPAATDDASTGISDARLEALLCSFGIGHVQGSEDDADAYRYREWDHCIADYVKDRVRVLERKIPVEDPSFYRQTLTRFPGMVGRIRYAFEQMRPEEITILRQWKEGDAFDYRALLDYAVDRRAGLIPSDRLFIKRMKQVRDVAALLLVDLSRSTANTVDRQGTRVLDVEKQAIVLLCEALNKVGDRFAIAGFSGTGPLGVDYYPVKNMNETLTDAVCGRIGAMAPQRSTRMGAAIRHATFRISSVQARVKLVIILSDGFPNDLAYKGSYAVEDTRRAVMEARTKGIHVRAITVNAADNGQLDRLYGPGHHTLIGNIHDLPGKLVRVYSALTRH